MVKKIYSGKEVAQWFINRSNFDGEKIDKIKLQKLLFFAQGMHLTVNSEPLFNDDFTNFKHGPVLKSVYPVYKEIEGMEIETLKNVDIDFETTEFLEKIYKVYGQYASWKLRDMSHLQKSYINSIPSLEITKSEIAKYFREDNKDQIKEFEALEIDEDQVERFYILNKHYSAFKVLAQ